MVLLLSFHAVVEIRHISQNTLLVKNIQRLLISLWMIEASLCIVSAPAGCWACFAAWDVNSITRGGYEGQGCCFHLFKCIIYSSQVTLLAQKVPFDLQVCFYLSWHADSTQMNKKISCEEISKCVNNQIRKILLQKSTMYIL